VGTVQIVVPDSLGPLTLELACHHETRTTDATNAYESMVVR
jgi:hypothetical protein